MLYKVIYRPSVISLKIPMSVFTKIEEHNLKIDMEPQKTADQLKKKD